MEAGTEFYVAGELQPKARRPKLMDKYGTWRLYLYTSMTSIHLVQLINSWMMSHSQRSLLKAVI